MKLAETSLTRGIRVDKATQKGSVNDVVRCICGKTGDHPSQTLSRILGANPQISTKCAKLRIDGKGTETPVADAATLVEIAWLLPGKTAAQFKRQAAESVCRLLGGDLTLVDEIQQRHEELNGTAEQEFLLAEAQNDIRQPIVPCKRRLDGDDEVYAAKKQQVLKQIKQETAGTELAMIRQHAQGSMCILDMLSTGNAPPATMQLLQTIRHNLTARLGSMIESGMQGMLAIEGAPQQQEALSINQQAQRWTVQMYANKMRLPSAACTADKLKVVGTAAAKIWTREKQLMTIERLADRTLGKVWFEPGSNAPQRASFLPEEEAHLLSAARMKYSLAYKGGYEAADRANFDTWTYPAQTGAEVLHEAFCRVQAMADAT